MTVRFLTIRPSLPHVQAERDQSIRQSRQRRATARLNKATAAPKATPTAPTAQGVATGLVAFARWFDTFRRAGLLDGLAGHEEARLRALAFAAFSGRADPAVWVKAVSALGERHKKASIAAEADYWRHQGRRHRHRSTSFTE